jgi:hypothetical protein
VNIKEPCVQAPQIEFRGLCCHFAQNLLSSSLLSKYVNTCVQNRHFSSCFYGCETGYLSWRLEDRLRVFEIRVLRKILGPKRDELTVEWRTLHNEELCDPYSLPSIIRVIKSRM